MSVPGDGEGRDGITRFEQKLYTLKSLVCAWSEPCAAGALGACLGEALPAGEPRGCHTVWVTVAGCAVSLRSCPATSRAQEGSGSQGFTHHVLPSQGNLQGGRSFKRKPLLCFLVFIPWKFFPAALVLPGVHGMEHSSDSDRDGSAPWHPSSVLVSSHLCWHTAWAGTSSSIGFWHSIPLELLVN